MDPVGLNAPPVILFSSAPGKTVLSVADICIERDALFVVDLLIRIVLIKDSITMHMYRD